MFRLMIVALLALLALPAHGAQYACATVDAGAVAFVDEGLPVSIVETRRTCQISVDGKVASGRGQNFVGAMNGLSDTLFFSEGQPYEFPAEMLRDMIAGPFGDRGDREGGSFAPEVADELTGDAIFGMSQCIRDFTDIVNENDNGADTPLTQMGQMTDGAVQCVVVPPNEANGPGNPRSLAPVIDGGALRLSVSSPDAMLTLYLPADWLRDARDGNGTFQ